MDDENQAFDQFKDFEPKNLGFCPYQLLGLNTPTFDESGKLLTQISNEAFFKIVKSNYRKLALKNHPDRFPNDDAKRHLFEQLKKASDVLLHTVVKQRYDDFLRQKYFTTQRYAQQNKERQKVIDDLLEREKAHDLGFNPEQADATLFKSKIRGGAELRDIIEQTKQEEKEKLD